MRSTEEKGEYKPLLSKADRMGAPNGYAYLNESISKATEGSTDVSSLGGKQHLEGVLGYESVLTRTLSTMSSFAFGFTEVAVLASFTSLYGSGLALGGPRTIVWAWLVTWSMLTIASFSMAEICSAYPLAGSVYNWAAQVVPPQHAPLAAYVTGVFNFLGNAAGDASFANFFATFLNAALEASGLPSYNTQTGVAVGIIVLCVWTCLNWLNVDSVGWFQQLAACCHAGSIVVIIITILVGAASSPAGLQSSQWVWTDYENLSGFTDDRLQHRLNSNGYIETLGITVAMFAFSGFEASAHMAEETEGSQLAAPRGILYTVLATGLGGFLYLLALLYSTNNLTAIARTEAPVDGSTDLYYTSNAAVNVFVNSCGWGCGAALSWLVVLNIFFAGIAAVAVTGRITFALMRDGAFPYASYFAQVHPVWKSPVRCVNFVCAFDACLLLMGLNPSTGTAFQNIVGLCNVGFMISYALPITLKCYYQPVDFPKTPMSLGKWSVPMGVVASIWLYGTSILNFLPQSGPVTVQSFNYLGVVFTGLALMAAWYWRFGGGREGFAGPKRQSSAVVGKAPQLGAGEGGVVAEATISTLHSPQDSSNRLPDSI